MFEDEVNYRFAKWMLLNMEKDRIISTSELRRAWKEIAKYYNPPFLEVEDMSGSIGDGVTVNER